MIPSMATNESGGGQDEAIFVYQADTTPLDNVGFTNLTWWLCICLSKIFLFLYGGNILPIFRGVASNF